MYSISQKNKPQYTPSVSDDKKRIRFIINPLSGVRKRMSIENLIQKELDKIKFDYEIAYTEYAGHATELATEAVKEGFDIVVAVGGDGSVNEVAKSLIGTNTALGIVPAGSGNGFAMHLGWGRDIATVIRSLGESTVETFDSCLINDRPFINLAGVGFEAKVVDYMHCVKKRGFQAYVKAFFKHLFVYKFKHYHIKIDDEIFETEALTITVANAPMYGYNFIVAPFAKPDDGKLEVVVFKRANRLLYIIASIRMFTKSINQSPIIQRFSGERIEISLKEPDFAQVDGEGYATEEAKLVFTVNPLSLKVLVPKKKLA